MSENKSRLAHPASASLDDTLFQESANLGVVRARFEGFERSSFEELIAGYSSLKVLTYSNSVSIINRAAAAVERLEIIFGREDMLGKMGQYVHFQELLVEELVKEIKGQDYIKQKIAEGEMNLYVVKDLVSHEKLFLLEGEHGTRVITGSANFSEKGFSGSQNESYILFDNDSDAWEHFNEKYEKIKSRSSLPITKKALLAEKAEAENLPVFSLGEPDGPGSLVAVPESPPGLSIIHKMLKTPKRHTGLSEVIRSKNGSALVDKPTASRAVKYIKSNSRSAESNPEEYLTLDENTGRIILSGKELDLETLEEEVASDVNLLVEYFGGFDQFRGDTEKLKRDYFTFMSWFYASPFICDWRNAALAREDYVLDHPLFGILYGRSNCGKSELIKTLLSSMFQKEGFLPNEYFTRTRVTALMQENARYPLVFDDLDNTRFNNHAVALIKDDYVGLGEYPAIVLSMNADKDTFEPEVRKRCLIVYTRASLPDHTGESRNLARNVKRIKSRLSNALYREYLKRTLERLREDTPTDALALSSEVLHGIFIEHYPEPLPAWCRIISMDEYGQGKHNKVRDELIQLLRYSPSAWSIKQDKIVLRLDDVHGARKLLKDIPDYLVDSGSRGDAIIFDAKELKEFLGSSVPLRNTPFRSLGRLFGRRS
jgi:PLD-like domain